MGTSAFDPVILADVRSVRHKIDIAGACGAALSVGDVVRYDPVNDYYIPARANNTTNANFVGIIESLSETEMVLVYSGEINLPSAIFSAMGSGYTAAQVFYLSDTQAGKMTFSAPSSPGSVIKPVMMVNSDLSGYEFDGIVINTAGDVIQGDSSVDISEIQPVGSILAFAGNRTEIPTGWELCDGGFLDNSAYSDLYTALNQGKIYGFSQVINLSYIGDANAQSITQQDLVGKKFYFSPINDNTRTIECTILSGTVSTPTTITNLEVDISPFYTDGEYHNTQGFAFGNFVNITDSSNVVNNYTVTVAASPTKFRKPDLRSRFIIGDSRGITGVEDPGFDSYTTGKKGGEEYHTLTYLEIPSHSHDSTTTFQLTTSPAGAHNHGIPDGLQILAGPGGNARASGYFQPRPWQAEPNHTHGITGNINVSIANFGGNLEHNNVPQHVVMAWIIKTRKDSVAKLYKLGPNGGGAIIAKNTAKRWARSSSGAGCTVDISYGSGTWTVARLGTGDYRFTHDMITELGTADQDKYIVEASVIKNGSGATQMFVANPYNLQGLTFGVKVYDIMGSTFSDNFQYLSLTIYGGGTAL